MFLRGIQKKTQQKTEIFQFNYMFIIHRRKNHTMINNYLVFLFSKNSWETKFAMGGGIIYYSFYFIFLIF